MTSYVGIDVDQFPGLTELEMVKKNTNAVWVSYYLTAPSHSNAGWEGKRNSLLSQGWGLAPIFVGQQVIGPGSHSVNSLQGTSDGLATASKMIAEGFPVGSCVFLDLENGPPFSSSQAGYVSAWYTAVAKAGWAAGIYCSHLIAPEVAALVPSAKIWVFKVQDTNGGNVSAPFPDSEPSESGYAEAAIWQRAQNVTIEGNLVVDLNVSTTADPSGSFSRPDNLTSAAKANLTIEVSAETSPPIPLTPTVPQLPPPFIPAPVSPTPPTITTVATPARIGLSVASTGVLAGVTAMTQSNIVNLRGVVDLGFIYIITPIALGVIAGLAVSVARWLHVSSQSVLAEKLTVAAENGALALVSKAQTAAEKNATVTTKNEIIAGALNYVNTSVPDTVKALGLATPSGQAHLANLVEAKVQQVVNTTPSLGELK